MNPPNKVANPLDSWHAQLRTALDEHVRGLNEHLDRAVADARQEAALEAEQVATAHLNEVRAEWQSKLEEARARWAQNFEAARTEWEAKLDSEVAARTEAERRFVTELTKARFEAEQHAAESARQIKEDVERTLTAERRQAEAVAQAERVRLEAEVETARRQAREATDALAAQQQRAQTDRQQITADLRQAQADRARVEAELARMEGDRERIAGDLQRAHQEHETTRGDLERARADAEEHRQRRETDVAAVRAEAQAAADRAEAAAAASDAGRAAERQEQLAFFERLAAGIRGLDGAASLTQTLDALMQHASLAAPRVALFLLNGTRLRSWRAVGFPQLEAQPLELAASGDDLLARAVTAVETVGTGPSQPGPQFANIPPDRAGLALPLIVGGQAVAVLYADNVGPDAETPASWPEMIEALVRHASLLLALHTATRTLQALAPGRQAAQPVGTAGASDEGDAQSARRYARLLVSEIKLYNEPAVTAGRQHADLLNRLRPEIERARRLYEERVPSLVAGRTLYFQQELVQTLAGGDPALLGNT